MESVSLMKHLVIGFVLRMIFTGYGLYQDSNSIVSYTDIDYSVYTDAASYVSKGQSPYLRETYRYTPLLGWLLLPNITMWASYGKIIFSLVDLLTAYLIYLIVHHETGNPSMSRKCSFLWIYNPLPIVICSRGSSESLILCLVLAVLYLFHKGAMILTGLVFGFAVHFKIYPIPYCFPLYLAAAHSDNLYPWQNLLNVTKARVKLVLGSIIGFLIPTLICHQLYGEEFLNETYFYHISRKDIKHNFSLYFYMMYLNWDNTGVLLKVISFVPQLILMFIVAVLFPSPEDLSFTIFIQTYCFVIFNKVCTAQYFLWYLSILTVVLPKLNMKFVHSTILLIVWYFAQVAWLLPAYYLEFEGRNTYMYVWLESIAFFCANIGILVQIIKSYKATS